MNRSESKYFHTAEKMDQALLRLLEQKDFQFITVKELCETAGVNRSTFYLHYQNTRELLEETLRYIFSTFSSYFSQEEQRIVRQLATCPKEELLLITPEYLTPYLTYVRENRRVLQVAMKHADTMEVEQIYQRMFRHVFDPILERFHLPAPRRNYMMVFYLSGIHAIVMEWVRRDCADPLADIAAVIIDCCLPPLNQL